MVAIGLASAGLALALQEVIVSFAGWFAILLGRYFKPGDRIQLGGIVGDVIDIGVLRTALMERGQWVKADQYNGRIVRIANSQVFREPVFNYSGIFPFLWDEISLPIKYGCDLELARAILHEVAAEVVSDYARDAKHSWDELVLLYRLEDARIDPMVTLVANDNWMELTLRYIVDYKRRRVTKDELFTGLMTKISHTQGKIVIASATLAIVELPTSKLSQSV